jgi:multiple sugar transport system substrate-binding protein
MYIHALVPRRAQLGSTQHSRRSVLGTLATLAGAGATGSVLAACGTSATPGISLKIERPVTVTLLVNGNLTGVVSDTQKRLYETDFRAAQPNITVDFQASGASGADHIAKIIALNVAGTAPDAFFATASDIPSLVGKSMVRGVDDLMKADSGFKKDDWFETHLDAWNVQGKMRGLPWQGGPMITYFNKDLLTEGGVTTPTEATWTYDAWRDAGTKLRRVMSGGEMMRWAGDNGGPWLHWVYAFGGNVLDKDNKRCVLDSKEALTGLQMMVDFVHRDQIAPKPQDTEGKTNQQLFMAKREAMIVMNRQNASAKDFIQPWVGVTQLPKGPAGRFSPSNIDGFGMGANTKEAAAAWEAMKWRTGDALRRELLRTGNGGIPALKATANSQEYLNDKLPVEWNRLFISTMSILRLPPPIPAWTEINATVSQVMTQMLRGETTPASAIKELVPRVNALLPTS